VTRQLFRSLRYRWPGADASYRLLSFIIGRGLRVSPAIDLLLPVLLMDVSLSNIATVVCKNIHFKRDFVASEVLIFDY
jgi:hypothetical protein